MANPRQSINLDSIQNQILDMNTLIDTKPNINQPLPLPLTIISCLLSINHIIGIASNFYTFVISVVLIMGAPLLIYLVAFIIRPFRKGYPIAVGRDITIMATDISAIFYNYFLFSLFKNEHEFDLDQQVIYPIINIVLLFLSIGLTIYYKTKIKLEKITNHEQDEIK